jgi:hypothetical protein
VSLEIFDMVQKCNEAPNSLFRVTATTAPAAEGNFSRLLHAAPHTQSFIFFIRHKTFSHYQ